MKHHIAMEIPPSSVSMPTPTVTRRIRKSCKGISGSAAKRASATAKTASSRSPAPIGPSTRGDVQT